MTKHGTTNLSIFRFESKTSYTTVSGQLLSLPIAQLSWDTRAECNRPNFCDSYKALMREAYECNISSDMADKGSSGCSPV